MNDRLRRVGWWARQGLLTGGAVLGTLCLLLTIGAALFGLRPLVFQSGSMSPTIGTGALAIAHDVDASSLRAGQVVSVPTGTGQRVTHRIVEVTRDGDVAQLELRGDANEASDAHTYRVTHADKVLFDVPAMGYVVGWLAGPVGLFLLGLYAAFLLSVLVKGSPHELPRTVLSPGLSVVLLLGVGAGISLERQVTPTLAAFTDPVAVSGTTLTARLPTPAGFTCKKGKGQRTQFDWSPVTLAGYTLRYDIGGSVSVDLPAGTTTFETPDNKDVGTVWVVATRTFAGQPWTSADTQHFAYNAGVCS